MTETKFCTSCQALRAVTGGVHKMTRGVPRWICQACIERKSESIYKSQRADAIEARKKNEQILDKFYEENAHFYTAPPQREWQSLTDEEYTTIMQQADHDAAKTGSVFQNLRYAIEAKLKEKNHG